MLVDDDDIGGCVVYLYDLQRVVGSVRSNHGSVSIRRCLRAFARSGEAFSVNRGNARGDGLASGRAKAAFITGMPDVALQSREGRFGARQVEPFDFGGDHLVDLRRQSATPFGKPSGRSTRELVTGSAR
jgi:hypothetical protein